MRCGSRPAVLILLLLLLGADLRTQPLSPIQRQRYSMGTMFDVIVYHASRPAAEEAIEKAMAEIDRLDRVLSDFEAESGLSKLVRDGRRGFVSVDPSLFEVIRESFAFSRASGGKFDITIAPVLRLWRKAGDEGRQPSADEISRARACVGYERIEMQPPDRIRLNSDCLEIDLGAIGKGYALDRAMAVLKAAGVQHALINAGSSSMAGIGAPPGQRGWPVTLAPRAGTFALRDTTISTSQQGGAVGHIVDPAAGGPAKTPLTVSVIAPRGTVSDALSTTLLLLSKEEGMKLLPSFGDVSAFWLSAEGKVLASYRASELHITDGR